MGLLEYSFSKLDDANYCLMRYYLRWIERAAHPNPPYFFKGDFFHDITENFWSRLGSKDEITRKKGKVVSEKKYSSAEEFADYAHRQWMHKVIQNKNSKDPKRKVDWERHGQEFLMGKQARDISYHVFDHLIELGKPLYQEIKFDFVIGHRRFKGRIDAIRTIDGKVIIDDFKSGRPWIGQMKISHDPQMSMYNVGLAALCFNDENFAASLGLNGRRQQFKEDPTYLVEEVENRFIMLEAPAYWANVKSKEKIEEVPFIHPTNRKKEHFYEILKMLDGVEKSIKQGIIYPERGRKCDSCVMKKPCEARLEESILGHPQLKGQFVFNFAAPIYALPLTKDYAATVYIPTKEGIAASDPNQEMLDFKRSRKSIIQAP